MKKPARYRVKAVLVACLFLPFSSCFKKKELHSNLVGPPPPEEFSEEGFKRFQTLINMNRSYVDRQPNLHNDLQTGARFDRKPEGLRIGRIMEDSIYTKLGFWDGDIILEPIDNFPDSLESKLKKDRFIEIRILRNGVDKTIKIHIK